MWPETNGPGPLIAGCEAVALYFFQTCPAANYFPSKAMSVGAHSQTAHTYLERRVSVYGVQLNELGKHGAGVLQQTLPAEGDLSTKNVSIVIAGKDSRFRMTRVRLGDSTSRASHS